MSTMLGGCTILMRIVDHFEQVLCEIYESLAHDIDPRMVVSLSRAFVVLLAAQRPSDSDEPWLSNPACPTSRVQMGAAAHARRVDGARAGLQFLHCVLNARPLGPCRTPCQAQASITRAPCRTGDGADRLSGYRLYTSLRLVELAGQRGQTARVARSALWLVAIQCRSKPAASSRSSIRLRA
jgi:hypothetical protein